jgi:hypothetical protein
LLLMKSCCFEGIIRIRGINPYLHVSRTRAESLRPGWRKALPVLMRINGKPRQAVCTNMMPTGNGDFYLYLNGVIRKAAGVDVGDRVQVEIAFDATYRNGPQHPMPEWFAKALRGDARARKNWQRLIPSRKKEVLRYFAQLKSDEARARNLVKAMDALSGQEVRFMARTWRDGA